MALGRTRRGLALAAAAALGLGLLALAIATPAALTVLHPRDGSVVGSGGLEVMVRFPDGGQAATETFRVLLNGADLTPEFTTGSNGAYGRLHGLLEGENTLRFEVFARRWWLPGLLLLEAREVRVVLRTPQDWARG